MNVGITTKALTMRNTRAICDNKITVLSSIISENCNPDEARNAHYVLTTKKFELIFTKNIKNDGDRFWKQVKGKFNDL